MLKTENESFTRVPANKTPTIAILLIASLLFLALGFLSANTLRPWIDEGMFASAGHNFAEHGSTGTTVLADNGRWTRIQQHTYWIMPLHTIAQGVWYNVFGFGLIPLRSLSLFWGLIAIGSLFVVVDGVTQRRPVALLAAFLFSVNYILNTVASSGRNDMMSAGLGALGLALFVTFRNSNLTMAILLCHIAIAASVFTHPNAILWFAVSLFLIIAMDHQRIAWVKHTALAALPYLIGIAGWLIFISQDMQAFRDQFAYNAVGNNRMANLTAPWKAIQAEIVDRYLQTYGLGAHSVGHSGPIVLKAWVLLVYIVSVIGVLAIPALRLQRGTKLLVGSLGLVFLIQCFFNQKLSDYLVHTVPFYSAVVAIFAFWCWEQRNLWRWMAVGALAAMVVVEMGGIVYRARMDPYHRRYLPAMKFIKDHASPHQLVAGSADIVFALGGGENVQDDRWLGKYSKRIPDFVVEEEAYQEAWGGLKMHHADDYQYVDQLLKSQYRLVYDQNFYKIYQRIAER